MDVGRKFRFIMCACEELEGQKFEVSRMTVDKRNCIACKTKTEIVVAIASTERNVQSTARDLNISVTVFAS